MAASAAVILAITISPQQLNTIFVFILVFVLVSKVCAQRITVNNSWKIFPYNYSNKKNQASLLAWATEKHLQTSETLPQCSSKPSYKASLTSHRHTSPTPYGTSLSATASTAVIDED